MCRLKDFFINLLTHKINRPVSSRKRNAEFGDTVLPLPISWLDPDWDLLTTVTSSSYCMCFVH